MKRVRATALLAAFGLVGYSARGDDVAWKSSGGVSAPAPTPAVTTPAPVALTPIAPVPSVEPSTWAPARSRPIDPPPKPVPPPTPPATPVAITPLPADAPVVFRPATHDPFAKQTVGTDPTPPPVSLPEPRAIVPDVLPPLARLPQPTGEPPAVQVPKLPDPKPADPKATDSKAPPSASLPAPRQVYPGKPVPLPTGSAFAPPDCSPNPPVTPAGAAAPAGVPAPARHKVFGSPEMMLSRDYAFRDLLGMDLLTEPHGRGLGRLRNRFGARELGDGVSEAFFVQAELLLWWANRPRVPVLASTSASGTGFGFLGDPDTRTLLGPGSFGPGFQAGLRVRAGAWLDECGTHGIDGSYFFLGRGKQTAAFDSAQNAVITRPIFAPNFNAEFGEVVALPNLSTGRLEVEQDSLLWGADLNYKCAVCRTCDTSRGWFVGFRHLNLTERLSITETITATGTLAGDPAGTRVVVGDRFETRNRFYGGQVGYWWQRRADRWELDARASVALGVTNHTLDISGFQRRTRPGEATQSFNGGLLATGPNLGQFRRSSFSVAPEATVNVGYRLTDNLKVYAGYNFLYWTNVMRPGDQIDRVVDVTLVPNPPPGVPPSGQNRPQPTFAKSDFWAQGVQLGLEFRW